MNEFTPIKYKEISEYVDLEGTEIGDYLSQLLVLWDIPESHGKNKLLQKAIDAELWRWLKRFRREAKIIEITKPRPDLVYKELEWL